MMRSARADRRAGRPPRQEEVATVTIESIAAGGDGVTRINGRACFVPRTAPGDVVQIAYTAYARFARGRVLQILDGSGQRETPRCHHYDADRCGGCRLQHMTKDAQHHAVQQIVRDAFQRVGHREIPVPAIISGEQWAYRERLTLTLRQRGSSWIGGLHAIDDPSRVFALTECPVSHPVLIDTWHAVRDQLRGLPAAPKSGEPMRLALRISGGRGAGSPQDSAQGTKNAEQVAVIVLGGTRWPDSKVWGGRVQAAGDRVSSVWWIPTGATPKRLWPGGDAADGTLAGNIVLAGDDDGGEDDVSFAQINSRMAALLREHVYDVIHAAAPASVVEAYSGSGELAFALASTGVHVTAIESDATATARAAQRLSALPNARVVTALVEDALPDALPADVVILNPPRRGVDGRVTSVLNDAADQGVRRIVYVSCDPATLARDVARLPRWRISGVQCFDMFPHTAHVETVCVLVPEES